MGSQILSLIGCESNGLIINFIIARLIAIDIAPLTVLLLIARCFVIARSLICNCPLLKDISFNTVFVGLV